MSDDKFLMKRLPCIIYIIFLFIKKIKQQYSVRVEKKRKQELDDAWINNEQAHLCGANWSRNYILFAKTQNKKIW